MKTVKNISITMMVSVVLILVIAFCISGTVMSQGKNAGRVEARFYRELEQAYVNEVRLFLEERGYENCGITMTKVIEKDGERNYTVTIHHKKLDNLSDLEQRKLLTECGRIEFPVTECGFSHKLLEKER